MITAEIIKEQLTIFANNKLAEVLGNGFLSKAFRPAVMIWINNNIDRLDPILGFVSNKDGSIDAISLISQYEETILNDAITTSFNALGGTIEIGQGKVKVSHKYLDKNQIFDAEDVKEFKELLTPKKVKKDVSET